ncbi:MAG: type II toxin-antitoxin system prevent-host-death family antitoxin [Paracoccaceae bacterium]|nr:type II toxin-antitoxin system prevent-host-death family antitoxin [Paracoccaceae bacterium]MDE2675824.1 type II toxin-antitoxin system prevent-host-death family antitoxin [Paracoccaceae bacterium]MDE2738136.1 type II toxin-antitoxin system prevent-host-death family antitoxin [Paracoccaceae bacterium]MXZ49753.1 type II toxin-antitoxin system prevent-host-death family antitoxin [Paracoccaceae bacterium]MYF46445.1 type II toxin-antitoxin system prevent-host-death family antitoxin [Paracoccacea
MHYQVHEARSQLSKLINAALRGEEVIITKWGHPVVRLVPLPQKHQLFGLLEGKISAPDDLFEPMSEEDLKLWESDLHLTQYGEGGDSTF